MRLGVLAIGDKICGVEILSHFSSFSINSRKHRVITHTYGVRYDCCGEEKTITHSYLKKYRKEGKTCTCLNCRAKTRTKTYKRHSTKFEIIHPITEKIKVPSLPLNGWVWGMQL